MSLQNSAEKFGSLTKLLHWFIFFLFVIQYFLVYRREYFPKDSPEKIQYMLLHKSLGISVLLLAFFMILWRKKGTRPLMPLNMSLLEIFAAKLTHFLLYLSMLVMPISGIMMSLLAGYSVSFFGWFNLPNPFVKNELLSDFSHSLHVWCSYFVIALVCFHVFGAIYHHFVRKDAVLKRMLPSF